VAQFLCFCLKELVKLAEFCNNKKDSVNFWHLALRMQETINRVAWDGNWYIRAFDTKGRPVGSSRCKEGGKIYLNSQSWAVLANIAPWERLNKCMNMVAQYLNTKYGIMLLNPPYQTFYPHIGAIGTFAPGLKENGGIFCHANPWAMIAETLLGRADKAFDYYKKMAPTAYNKIPQVHMTEPYVYSQFIAGKDSAEFGRARNSWLTGAAAWNFIAATWYILGIRPEYEGLRISPCIPKEWDGFKARRRFREVIYDIEIINPDHVSRGIHSITIEGKRIKGEVLPLFKPATLHKITVTMGGADA
jgi:cellobiose phosphorylase